MKHQTSSMHMTLKCTCVWILESFLFRMSLKAPHSPSMLSTYSHDGGKANLCRSKIRWPSLYIYYFGNQNMFNKKRQEMWNKINSSSFLNITKSKNKGGGWAREVCLKSRKWQYWLRTVTSRQWNQNPIASLLYSTSILNNFFLGHDFG